ncbi:hypothetical protein EDC96DRAFT_606114 [Choanephora cucurbitarum]|nr:hypothetical protein EDC96DRAFT_606114 [Choanephora cucurbitarum]
MDNNPFRNNQSPPMNGNYSYMSSNYQSQQPPLQQQQQQQQLPYQQSYNTGYPTPPNGYQQQPQSWQLQQQISNTPMMSQQTSSFSSYPPQTQASMVSSSLSPLSKGQYSAYTNNNDLMSSSISSSSNLGNTQSSYGLSFSMPNTNSFPATTNSMYMQQQYPSFQQQQQQQSSSNFYIPPNFGMSNYTSPPPSQPRHPPVDASSLLKGTQIRRVECPTCQKMIEGDDMAINHHVNQHFT